MSYKNCNGNRAFNDCSNSYSCWVPSFNVLHPPIVTASPALPALTIRVITIGGDDTFTLNISPAAGGLTTTTITTVGVLDQRQYQMFCLVLILLPK